MAATLLENSELDNEGAVELNQEELVENLTPALEPEPAPVEDLPEKYRGKSIQEVVAMHQSAEQLIGTQGSEVGELRKVVDQFIQGQSQQQDIAEEEPLDFFENPEQAVSQAIERHPDVVQARESAAAMQRSSSLTQLQAKHPDMQDVLNNPSFSEWVQASPIRVELYQRADKGYDFSAADELVSTFKERTHVAQQAITTETSARQASVKQASTGSATGASTGGTKRIYRRADIIKLMKTDPDRYEALNPEIMLAYQEGRVR